VEGGFSGDDRRADRGGDGERSGALGCAGEASNLDLCTNHLAQFLTGGSSAVGNLATLAQGCEAAYWEFGGVDAEFFTDSEINQRLLLAGLSGRYNWLRANRLYRLQECQRLPENANAGFRCHGNCALVAIPVARNHVQYLACEFKD